MKTSIIVLISLLFTFFPSLSFGQSYKQILDAEMVTTQNLLNEKVEHKQQLEKTNEIFIQQIGDQNTVTSKVTSTSSKVNLNQIGNLNNIDFNITAKSYLGKIDQKGNNNTIFDKVYAPGSNISLNLSQNGSNQLFERHGSNSIGNKLKIKIKGNDKSIIVRNSK